jgi:hypothetical protein
MSRPREIQSFEIAWQGIAIAVTYERNAKGLADSEVATSAHLAITAEMRRPLPFTESGYLSRFVDPADIDAEGGPAAYVLTWLEHAARSPQWRNRRVAGEQLALF